MKRIALALVLLVPALAVANDDPFLLQPGVEGIADAPEASGIHCGDVAPGDAVPFEVRGDAAIEPHECAPIDDGNAEGIVDDINVDWAMAW